MKPRRKQGGWLPVAASSWSTVEHPAGMAGCALQVANAQAAGAAAVLVGNTQATGFMRMQPDPPTPGFESPNTVIPSASLPRNSATPLAAALAAKQVRTLLHAGHGT